MVCNACPKNKIAMPPVVKAWSFTVMTAPSVPGKARTVPGGPPTIQVDRPYWARLNDGQRRALVAHEIAHHEDPRLCEHCTDMRAGARLRYEGATASQVAADFGAIVAGRNAARNAVEGWALADKAIRGRAGHTSGLLRGEGVASLPPVYRGLDMRYADGTTDLFRSRNDGDAWHDAVQNADENGQSIGTPDVDGTSVGTVDTTPRRTPSRKAKGSDGPANTDGPVAASSTTFLLLGAAAVAALLLFRR